MSTTMYIINNISSLTINQISPFDLLFQYPSIYHDPYILVVFVFILSNKKEQNKLFSKSAICFFLGYGTP